MAFIRWNEVTQIWEKANTPSDPITSFVHLPVANPTDPLDIANKAYVDTAVSGGLANIAYTNLANVFTTTQSIAVNGGATLSLIDTAFPIISRRFNITNYGQELYFQATDDPPTTDQGNVRITRIGAIKERSRNIPLGEWVPWTPVWKSYSSADGVIGNGTLSGRYTLVGKTVYYTIRFVIGSTTAFPASYWAFTLPFPCADITNLSGSSTIRQASGNVFTAQAIPAGYYYGIADAIGLVASSVPGVQDSLVSVNHPFSWAVADQAWISGFYEIP